MGDGDLELGLHISRFRFRGNAGGQGFRIWPSGLVLKSGKHP